MAYACNACPAPCNESAPDGVHADVGPAPHAMKVRAIHQRSVLCTDAAAAAADVPLPTKLGLGVVGNGAGFADGGMLRGMSAKRALCGGSGPKP